MPAAFPPSQLPPSLGLLWGTPAGSTPVLQQWLGKDDVGRDGGLQGLSQYQGLLLQTDVSFFPELGDSVLLGHLWVLRSHGHSRTARPRAQPDPGSWHGGGTSPATLAWPWCHRDVPGSGRRALPTQWRGSSCRGRARCPRGLQGPSVPGAVPGSRRPPLGPAPPGPGQRVPAVGAH